MSLHTRPPLTRNHMKNLQLRPRIEPATSRTPVTDANPSAKTR